MYLVEAVMAYEGSTLVGGRVTLEDAAVLAAQAQLDPRWAWHNEISITRYPEGDFDGYKNVEVVDRLRIDRYDFAENVYEMGFGFVDDGQEVDTAFMFGGREPKGYYRRAH